MTKRENTLLAIAVVLLLIGIGFAAFSEEQSRRRRPATYDGVNAYTTAQTNAGAYGGSRAYYVPDHAVVHYTYANGHVDTWATSTHRFVVVRLRGELGPGDALQVSWHPGAATGSYWRVPALGEPATIWLRGSGTSQIMTVTVPRDTFDGIEHIEVRRASDGLLMVPLTRIDQLPVMTYAELEGQL